MLAVSVTDMHFPQPHVTPGLHAIKLIIAICWALWVWKVVVLDIFHCHCT